MEATAQLHNIFPLITRPHLTTVLESALNSPIVLVCTPPGYGKTTAISQFVDSRREVVVWYSLDALDRDGFVLDRRFRRKLAKACSVLVEQPGFITNSAELATELSGRLETDVDEPLIIVLDDVHHIDGFSNAEDWLNALVVGLPAHVHLILISRTVPPLPFTDLLADHQVSVIGPEHLAMSQRDLMYLGEAYPGHPRENLTTLIEDFSGWTTGVMLALRPIPAVLRGHFETDRIEQSFQEMAEKLFLQQSPTIRRFLLRSSVLRTLNPTLCERLLDLPDSTTALRTVRQTNLFLQAEADSWVYHPLFRDYLQQRLRTQQPDVFRQLHHIVGHALAAEGEVEAAFDHYILAADYAGAATLVEEVAQAYFIRGRHETLRWFAETLAHCRHPIPNLHLAVGMHCIDNYDYDRANVHLDAAERDFALIDRTSMLAEIDIQRATIAFQRGQYPQAIDSLAPIIAAESHPDSIQGHALRVLGMTYHQSGRIEEAIDVLELGLSHYEEVGDDLATSVILQDLQFAYQDGGYINEAERCLLRLVALRRQIGNPGELAIALNNLGFYHHTCGDYARAEETFDEGLKLARQSKSRRYLAYLLWSYGDLLRDTGRFDRAHVAYQEGLEIIGDAELYLKYQLLMSMVTLCRWLGTFHEGHQVAVEAETVAEAGKLVAEKQLARAQQLIFKMRIADSHPHAEFDDLNEQLNDLAPGLTLTLRTAKAACHLQANATELALDMMDTAQALAQRFHLEQSLAADVVHTLPVRHLVQAKGDRYPVLQHHIHLLNAAQMGGRPRPTLGLSEAVYTLRVEVLGPITITRDGRALSSTDWRSERSRDLFLYLLFNGKTSREALSNIFWPDQPAKRVRSNFHTTLHRARAAFGDDTILFESDRYFINPSIPVTCDALEFRKLIEDARPLAPRSPRTEDLLRRARALHNGPLLEDLYTTWAVDLQQTYGQLVVEMLTRLGDCARARDAVDEAIAHYKTALDHAPFREDIYRLLFSVLAGAGRRGEVVRHWEHVKSVFQNELMIAPSAQTQRFVESLLA